MHTICNSNVHLLSFGGGGRRRSLENGRNGTSFQVVGLGGNLFAAFFSLLWCKVFGKNYIPELKTDF